MKYSVLIPVYNVDEYLEECVDSILLQSYRDFEIVLVDDGSFDRSGEICESYRAQNPEQVKVIHTQNQGAALARMNGMQHATGDVFLFVDADDCLRIDAIDILNARFEETGSDLVLFNMSKVSDYSISMRKSPFGDGQVDRSSVFERLIISSELNPLVLKAVKRDLAMASLKEMNVVNVKHGEDLLMSLPIVTHANKISYINQNLYYYRQRAGSVVHSFNPNRHKSLVAVHTEMERYIDIWGMEDYHGKHYAREVRGWVECVKQLLKNWEQLMQEKACGLLRELSEDKYFKNAYENMEAGFLKDTEVVLAKWLYKGQYGRLQLVRIVMKIKIKLQLIKSNCG